MFRVERIRSRVFLLNFERQYELTMAFLRYQEFYEAADGRFRGSPFTIASFMGAYSSCKNLFSYPNDWSGFNIPTDVIRQVRDAGIDDPNHYDSLMHGVYELIRSAVKEETYLIGTFGEGEGVLDHELAHAMFALDKKYRKGCLRIISGSPRNLRKRMKDILMADGYCEKVIDDEIQAYLTTGLGSSLRKLKKKKGFKRLRKDLRKLHKRREARFK